MSTDGPFLPRTFGSVSPRRRREVVSTVDRSRVPPPISEENRHSGLKRLKSRSWSSIRRWEKENELLFAMIEDESEWLGGLFPEEIIAPEFFFFALEDGILLCKLANLIQEYAESYGKENNIVIPKSPVIKFHPRNKTRGQLGQFRARENVTEFLTWCRKHRVPEVILFESNDVVQTEELREGAREVVICLMEVARRSVKYGVKPPKLILLEKEIEEEEKQDEFGSPKSFDSGVGTENDLNIVEKTNTSNTLNNKLALNGLQEDQVINANKITFHLSEDSIDPKASNNGDINTPEINGNTDNSIDQPDSVMKPQSELDKKVFNLIQEYSVGKILRLKEGKYIILGRVMFVRMLNDHVLVRIGGGWDGLEHYLMTHVKTGSQSQNPPSTPVNISRSNTPVNQPSAVRNKRPQSPAASNPSLEESNKGEFRSFTPPLLPNFVARGRESPLRKTSRVKDTDEADIARAIRRIESTVSKNISKKTGSTVSLEATTSAEIVQNSSSNRKLRKNNMATSESEDISAVVTSINDTGVSHNLEDQETEEQVLSNREENFVKVVNDTENIIDSDKNNNSEIENAPPEKMPLVNGDLDGVFETSREDIHMSNEITEGGGMEVVVVKKADQSVDDQGVQIKEVKKISTSVDKTSKQSMKATSQEKKTVPSKSAPSKNGKPASEKKIASVKSSSAKSSSQKAGASKPTEKPPKSTASKTVTTTKSSATTVKSSTGTTKSIASAAKASSAQTKGSTSPSKGHTPTSKSVSAPAKGPTAKAASSSKTASSKTVPPKAAPSKPAATKSVPLKSAPSAASKTVKSAGPSSTKQPAVKPSSAKKPGDKDNVDGTAMSKKAVNGAATKDSVSEVKEVKKEKAEKKAESKSETKTKGTPTTKKSPASNVKTSDKQSKAVAGTKATASALKQTNTDKSTSKSSAPSSAVKTPRAAPQAKKVTTENKATAKSSVKPSSAPSKPASKKPSDVTKPSSAPPKVSSTSSEKSGKLSSKSSSSLSKAAAAKSSEPKATTKPGAVDKKSAPAKSKPAPSGEKKKAAPTATSVTSKPTKNAEKVTKTSKQTVTKTSKPEKVATGSKKPGAKTEKEAVVKENKKTEVAVSSENLNEKIEHEGKIVVEGVLPVSAQVSEPVIVKSSEEGVVIHSVIAEKVVTIHNETEQEVRDDNLEILESEIVSQRGESYETEELLQEEVKSKDDNLLETEKDRVNTSEEVVNDIQTEDDQNEQPSNIITNSLEDAEIRIDDSMLHDIKKEETEPQNIIEMVSPKFDEPTQDENLDEDVETSDSHVKSLRTETFDINEEAQVEKELDSEQIIESEQSSNREVEMKDAESEKFDESKLMSLDEITAKCDEDDVREGAVAPTPPETPVPDSVPAEAPSAMPVGQLNLQDASQSVDDYIHPGHTPAVTPLEPTAGKHEYQEEAKSPELREFEKEEQIIDNLEGEKHTDISGETTEPKEPEGHADETVSEVLGGQPQFEENEQEIPAGQQLKIENGEELTQVVSEPEDGYEMSDDLKAAPRLSGSGDFSENEPVIEVKQPVDQGNEMDIVGFKQEDPILVDEFYDEHSRVTENQDKEKEEHQPTDLPGTFEESYEDDKVYDNAPLSSEVHAGVDSDSRDMSSCLEQSNTVEQSVDDYDNLLHKESTDSDRLKEAEKEDDYVGINSQSEKEEFLESYRSDTNLQTDIGDQDHFTSDNIIEQQKESEIASESLLETFEDKEGSPALFEPEENYQIESQVEKDGNVVDDFVTESLTEPSLPSAAHEGIEIEAEGRFVSREEQQNEFYTKLEHEHGSQIEPEQDKDVALEAENLPGKETLFSDDFEPQKDDICSEQLATSVTVNQDDHSTESSFEAKRDNIPCSSGLTESKQDTEKESDAVGFETSDVRGIKSETDDVKLVADSQNELVDLILESDESRKEQGKLLDDAVLTPAKDESPIEQFSIGSRGTEELMQRDSMENQNLDGEFSARAYAERDNLQNQEEEIVVTEDLNVESYPPRKELSESESEEDDIEISSASMDKPSEEGKKEDESKDAPEMKLYFLNEDGRIEGADVTEPDDVEHEAGYYPDQSPSEQGGTFDDTLTQAKEVVGIVDVQDELQDTITGVQTREALDSAVALEGEVSQEHFSMNIPAINEQRQVRPLDLEDASPVDEPFTPLSDLPEDVQSPLVHGSFDNYDKIEKGDIEQDILSDEGEGFDRNVLEHAKESIRIAKSLDDSCEGEQQPPQEDDAFVTRDAGNEEEENAPMVKPQVISSPCGSESEDSDDEDDENEFPSNTVEIKAFGDVEKAEASDNRQNEIQINYGMDESDLQELKAAPQIENQTIFPDAKTCKELQELYQIDSATAEQHSTDMENLSSTVEADNTFAGQEESDLITHEADQGNEYEDNFSTTATHGASAMQSCDQEEEDKTCEVANEEVECFAQEPLSENLNDDKKAQSDDHTTDGSDFVMVESPEKHAKAEETSEDSEDDDAEIKQSLEAPSNDDESEDSPFHHIEMKTVTHEVEEEVRCDSSEDLSQDHSHAVAMNEEALTDTVLKTDATADYFGCQGDDESNEDEDAKYQAQEAGTFQEADLSLQSDTFGIEKETPHSEDHKTEEMVNTLQSGEQTWRSTAHVENKFSPNENQPSFDETFIGTEVTTKFDNYAENFGTGPRYVYDASDDDDETY